MLKTQIPTQWSYRVTGFVFRRMLMIGDSLAVLKFVNDPCGMVITHAPLRTISSSASAFFCYKGQEDSYSDEEYHVDI